MTSECPVVTHGYANEGCRNRGTTFSSSSTRVTLRILRHPKHVVFPITSVVRYILSSISSLFNLPSTKVRYIDVYIISEKAEINCNKLLRKIT